MVQCILNDERQILPCSAFLTGQYGLKDVFIGVPVRLGEGGVEEIIELELTPAQMEALHKSADAVREGIQSLKNFGLL
jgi:malate dehydrogenase